MFVQHVRLRLFHRFAGICKIKSQRNCCLPKPLLLLAGAFLFLAGCASVKPAPFQEFSQSIQTLKEGADKALEANETKSSDRFMREALSTVAAGNPEKVEKLRFEVKSDDPFSLNPGNMPLFMKAKQFRDAVRSSISVVEGYADLLVRLSSPELLPRETFDKMASDLNANAYDAVSSLAGTGNIPDPKQVAIFSTIAVKITQEYLESKRRSKLVEALTSNQTNIDDFSQHMRKGVLIIATHSAHEYDEESQELIRKLITDTGPAPESDCRGAIDELIELDKKYLAQLGVLKSLYHAFGKLPSAHAELATAAANPDVSISTIVGLVEDGKHLKGVYDKSLAVNKVKASRAIADRSVAMADKLDTEAEMAQKIAVSAQAEADKAKSEADAAPSDSTKQERASRLQDRAKRLKDVVESRKKKAAEARAAADEAQKQADEIEKTM